VCSSDLIDEGKLTWYTAAALEASNLQAQSFMDRYPFIEVEVFRQTGGPLAERFNADNTRGEIVADALLHSSPSEFKSWVDEGRFAAYVPKAAASLPDSLRIFEPNGYPDRIVTIALVYNSDLVTPEQEAIINEKGWEALADPAFRGRVALVDPALAGSAFNHYYIMTQELGWDYMEDFLARVNENEPVFFASNVPASGGVGSGEYLITPIVEFFGIDQVALGAPVKMSWPEPVPAYYGTLGVVEGAPNPNAARLFVEWFVSEEGQRAWVRNYNVKSANPNVTDTRAHTKAPWFTSQPTLEGSTFADLEQQVADRERFFAMFNAAFPGR
jgi:iron(III) transport system substrate-binding protein